MKNIIKSMGVLLFCFFTLPFVQAQEPDSAILIINAVSDFEELDEYLVERFDQFSRHPINLNTASLQRLASSGLFNDFQLQSLVKYRKESGDILSYAELAVIPGFNQILANALRAYTSLDSYSTLGESSLKRRNSSTMIGRADTKAMRFKYRFEAEDLATASIALKKYYGQKTDLCSASLSMYSRKLGARLMLGDFNASFGQGLALMTGFNMSSISSISSFYKKNKGISPAWTYSDSHLRGIASDINLGSFMISLLGAKEVKEINKGKGGMLLGGNVSRTGRRDLISLTAVLEEGAGGRFAADYRLSQGKMDYYSEVLYNVGSREIEAVGGATWNVAYLNRYALRFRWQKDEVACHLGAEHRGINIIGAAMYKSGVRDCELRLLCQFPWNLAEQLAFKFRLASKYWTMGSKPFRTEIRSQLAWAPAHFRINLRLDAVYCRELAALGYLEAGFSQDRFSSYLRCSLFSVKNWDDRIYVYERDAPGSFNVPAYYGEGYAASFVTGVKNKKKNIRFDLRASLIDYKEVKPDKVELKIQLSWDF